jgi:serine/threonine protein kinase
MEDLTGRTLLKNFELKEKKPSGQISDVYRAFDRQKGVPVAVKVMRRDFVNNKEFMRFFSDEAQFMNELEHPNIVRFYDFFRDGNLVFIVMDWVNGSNLKEILRKRRKPFSQKETLDILDPVCSALNYAHSKGIVHCDIKPSNIMRDVNKRVVLTDFGIARRSKQQMSGGTPPYMAPEQFANKPITPQTDLYALGVTTYEMLSGGSLPFTGETSQTRGSTLQERIYWEIMHLPYPPISRSNRSVPGAVDDLIRQALSRAPGQRPNSAMHFLGLYRTASRQKKSSRNLDITALPLDSSPQPSSPPSDQQIKPPNGRPIRGAYLKGLSGYWRGYKIPVMRVQFTIGRQRDNILRIPDRGVSRKHATLLAARNGFFIRDENSTAGTYLNGSPVHGPQLVKRGDVIQIGYTEKFEFWR